MYAVALGCVIGVVVVLALFVPSWSIGLIGETVGVISMAALGWGAWRVVWLRWLLLGMVLGSGITWWRVEQVMTWSLPQAWTARPIMATGVIASLPRVIGNDARFELALETLNQQPTHARVLVSWYTVPNHAQLDIGARWQLWLRLKPAHGLLNPGGFDYEQWLFAHGIRATGSVINDKPNTYLGSSLGYNLIGSLRQALQAAMARSLQNQSTRGLITALVMGAQTDISAAQWQVMRATGTNHLMAIAGVHIGFVAGFAYLLVNWVWRRRSSWVLWLPAQQAGVWASLCVAAIYSMLAGFALPTQRALLMLTVVMVSAVLRRQLGVWNAFFLALLGVLLLDPLAVLGVSFWLSFGAVAALIYGCSSRLGGEGWLQRYLRVQWVVSIALIPLTVVLFQQVSVVTFVANAIAVPAVGMVVLPLSLLGALTLGVMPLVGNGLLLLAAHAMTWVWVVLAWLAKLPGAVWQPAAPHGLVLSAAVVGVIIVLAPRGWPARWLGVCWFLPLLFQRIPTPHYGEAWLTVLDVGQGLATVVRTQRHTLVFDTGPSFGPQDDAGTRVLVPFLHAAGVRRVDMLVVSHGDNDHSGGVQSLWQAFPVAQLLSSVPERFPAVRARFCQSGQSWQWDGVVFSMLYPPPQRLGLGNNSSCVLKVAAGRDAALLTGDIEQSTEAFLLHDAAKLLPSSILVAPHHGSATSSTPAFINAVAPRYVLFSVGYYNRFHFPAAAVIARYRARDIQQFTTARDGAITLHWGGNDMVSVATYRERRVPE